MPAVSKFHKLYEENKNEYIKDAKIMTQLEFMHKNKIGNNTYDLYFK